MFDEVTAVAGVWAPHVHLFDRRMDIDKCNHWDILPITGMGINQLGISRHINKSNRIHVCENEVMYMSMRLCDSTCVCW